MSQYYPQGYQPYPAPRQQGTQTFTGPGGHQAFITGQPGFTTGSPGVGGMPASPAGTGGAQVPGMLPIEQSYIENILRLNKGKLINLFATFEGNTQWNAREFTGVIEAAGRDHVILSDPQSGARFLIPMVALDYITFSEPIEYEYPFGAGPALGTYSPR